MANKTTKTKTSTTVVTGLVRFSYVHVFEKYGVDGNEPKYSCQLIIDKSDKATLSKIYAAIDEAVKNGESKLKNKNGVLVTTGLKMPLRDGDTDPEKAGDETYKDKFFLNANSNRQPGVVDRKVQKIIDPDSVYSGGYGKACVTFFAFNASGNKGIAVGLQHIQWLKDGEPLGGGISAEAAFEEMPEEERETDTEEDKL